MIKVYRTCTTPFSIAGLLPELRVPPPVGEHQFFGWCRIVSQRNNTSGIHYKMGGKTGARLKHGTESHHFEVAQIIPNCALVCDSQAEHNSGIRTACIVGAHANGAGMCKVQPALSSGSANAHGLCPNGIASHNQDGP
jgi:hypothetical protein